MSGIKLDNRTSKPIRNLEIWNQVLANTQEFPLPLNENGTLSFYWIDAHEENNGTDLYIFGKIYQPQMR